MKCFKGFADEEINAQFQRICDYISNSMKSPLIDEIIQFFKINSDSVNVPYEVAKFLISFSRPPMFGFSSKLRELENNFQNQEII